MALRRSKPITSTEMVQITERVRADLLPQVTARVARQELARIEAVAPAPYQQFVDGRAGAPLETVKPGGVILFRFSRLGPAIDWIYAELIVRSPVLTGRYRDHHRFYVNGEERDASTEGGLVDVPADAEVIFMDIEPYARKIERGSSVQAPTGVYEMVWREAKKRFPYLSLEFTYRGLVDGSGAPTSAAGIAAAKVRGGVKVHNRSDVRYPCIIMRAAF